MLREGIPLRTRSPICSPTQTCSGNQKPKRAGVRSVKNLAGNATARQICAKRTLVQRKTLVETAFLRIQLGFCHVTNGSVAANNVSKNTLEVACKAVGETKRSVLFLAAHCNELMLAHRAGEPGSLISLSWQHSCWPHGKTLAESAILRLHWTFCGVRACVGIYNFGCAFAAL